MFLTLAMLAAGPAAAQSADEIAFARGLLNSLQEQSFAEGREYCGYLGYLSDGTLAATKPRRGREGSCTVRNWPRRIEVIASYHTHGDFDPDYYNETPSVEDVLADADSEIDGYVATPGGRFWFVNGETGAVRQLCPRGCLRSDPKFQAGAEGPVRDRYDFDQLRRRFDG